jgi:HSP20 family molecular chaperone IbpA
MALQPKRNIDDWLASPFEDFFRSWNRAIRNMDVPSDRINAWTPSVDVKSTDKDIIVHAELPGVKKEVL